MKKRHKIIIMMVVIFLCYIFTATFAANKLFRIDKKENIVAIGISQSSQSEKLIEDEQLVKKVASCWKNQVLLGALWYYSTPDNCSTITFYDGRGNCLAQYSYSMETGRIYPGGIRMPKETYNIMSQL